MAAAEEKALQENPHAEKPVDEMVLYEKVDKHIAKITLNRPEKGNAILAPVSEDELQRKMEMAEDDDDVKVVILTGPGATFAPARMSAACR